MKVVSPWVALPTPLHAPPGSNLVLSAACLYFSGRLSHRGVGRGDGKVRGAPVDCGPEGESWGGIAEW